MNTKLGDLLSEAQVITDLWATDRWEAIDELIDHLIRIGKVKSKHREAIRVAVRKRESAMSTGIGLGVAIPHASTNLVHETAIALGRSKQRINFDALDGQPVSLVILFIIPPGQFQKHLQRMARVYKLLQRPDFHLALEQAPDAAAMLQIIRGEPPPPLASS